MLSNNVGRPRYDGHPVVEEPEVESLPPLLGTSQLPATGGENMGYAGGGDAPGTVPLVQELQFDDMVGSMVFDGYFFCTMTW